MTRTKLSDRVLPPYTRGEEIMNMVTHIVGGALGIVALILCVAQAVIHKHSYGVVSGAIFGATMILLFTMSSIYHGLKPHLIAKKVFQIIDHCAIFVLISGTYTPIVLCTIRETNPDAWIVARASKLENISRLRKAGADKVVSPEVSGGKNLYVSRPVQIKGIEKSAVLHSCLWSGKGNEEYCVINVLINQLIENSDICNL